jgi:hypothetical protein
MRFLEIILCKKRKDKLTSKSKRNNDQPTDEIQVVKIPFKSKNKRNASKQNKLKKKYVYLINNIQTL